MDFLRLCAAMGIVLLSWVALGAALVGVGLLVQRRSRGVSSESTAAAFWIGLCVWIAFLQVYHCFHRVDGAGFGLLAIAGSAGLLIHARGLAAWAIEKVLSRKMLAALMVIAAVFMANRAVGPPEKSFDTGLYHAAAVRWAVTEPIVPGLTNLHPRLGFNNSIHLVGAALTAGPWGERACHIVNGLILLVAGVQSMAAARRLWSRQEPGRTRDVIEALMLPFIAVLSVRHEPAGFATDGAAAALMIVGTSSVARMIDGQGRTHEALWLAFLALGTAVTVKLSAAPYAAAVLLVAAAKYAFSPGEAKRRRAGSLVIAAALSALVVVPWMARGVILSGYPMYPSTALGFDVDWRVPREAVQEMSLLIRSWARAEAEVVYGWSWVGPWFNRSFLHQILMVGVPSLLIAIGIGRYMKSSRRSPLFPLVGACAAAIGAWFWLGPDPRFGSVMFWLLTGVLAAAADRDPPTLRSRRGAVAAAVCFGIFALTQKMPLNGPGPDIGFHPMPRAQVVEVFSRHGVGVFVPVGESRCWDAPLPNAPKLNPDLAYRRPESLRDGFRVERGRTPSTDSAPGSR